MAVAETTSRDAAPAVLPGVGRALVLAGKLSQKVAEDTFRKAKAGQKNFISELIESGAIAASDLAHTLAQAFSAPLLDVDALDVQHLPKDLIDPKLSLTYRLLALSKRNGRLIVATADPSDHDAAERIKFSTQMGVEWVIAEFDKLTRLVEAHTKSASETMDNIVGGDFEFDEGSLGTAPTEESEAAQSDVEDAPVVKFLHKMLIDAFNMRASDLHFEPYEHQYRVRFRVDGELREIVSPPVMIKEKLASRIKVPRNDGTNAADYLLGNEKITCMAVDGANRKWIGTESSGLFLVSPDGLETIHSFNDSNSPLYSNSITSLAVHPKSGEVFIGTSKGLISFKGDAIAPEKEISELHIYPNPVRENFLGNIAIEGFSSDSEVIITDVSGGLVYKSTSLGGRVTWNGKNLNGVRVKTGVYLILATDKEGKKGVAGKVLVVK